MRADSPLWRVMGDAAQAQEAEALAKIRELLPDDGIARAWANVTFTDNNGRLNEVDVLLLTSSGLYIVELKGWHGELSGNQREWIHAGRRHPNPRILANSKAKRLASVLKDLAYQAGVHMLAVPFINEAIVLHGRDSKVMLDQFGAEHVPSLDVDELGPHLVPDCVPRRASSLVLKDDRPLNLTAAGVQLQLESIKTF